jgi:hypothetical protein
VSINDGGPAFPATYETGNGGVYTTNYETGMTLRDYFAAAALQGILAGRKSDAGCYWHRVSDAYEVADWMLKEREKSNANA